MSIRVKLLGTSRFMTDFLTDGLRRFKDLCVNTFCGSVTAPVEKMVEDSPDVLLLDIHHDGPAVLALADRVVQEAPKSKILILGVEDFHDAPRIGDVGARGYVWIKTPLDELPWLIERVYRDEYVCPAQKDSEEMFKQVVKRRQPPAALTRTQRMVLPLLAKGYTNAKIAEELGVTPDTVKHCISRMFELQKVDNRHALVDLALKRRWIKAG